MADNDPGGVHLGFYSAALPEEERRVSLVGLSGREELSRLFELELLLHKSGAPFHDDELEALVSEPCVAAFGTSTADVVHGVLASVEHVGGTRDRGAYYRAKMVPHVWALTLAERSAVYQDTTVPDMVAAILTAYGLRKGRDFDLRVNDDKKSPKHEYIVQYQESDWDFISRWLEHEGYFYWFTHGAGAGLVVADANADATPIAAPTTLHFRERNNLGADDEDTIWALHAAQRRVPASVTLVDYNYRRPRDMLIASHKVPGGSFGNVFRYGDHFKDVDVGAALAKLRAEELACQRHVVSGASDCARLRVGHSFTLDNHYHADYDGQYLLTSVLHTAGASTDLEDEELAKALPSGGYKARFTAIPYDVPFRPSRVTPWPSIHGVVHGHVESDTSGDYAQVDDAGRYKVKLPFDLGTKSGTASSRWVRMMQASAGAGYGSHHPLRKGTEVMLAHVDGDPDRPVILGAVPNAATPGPVLDANASQSVVHTASGIRVVMEDLQG